MRTDASTMLDRSTGVIEIETQGLLKKGPLCNTCAGREKDKNEGE